MADYTLSAKGTYDGSNFDSGIEGSKSKLDTFMDKASQIGSRIKSALGDGAVKAADAVTSGIGTIGAAVTGLAAVGGINRALNIEQAQYKIKQMGLDVEAVMASCNEAVRGTAYGLDAAATVASSLGASGVQAGDQMTQALKGVAGMAAMSGRSMEDVGLIFGKVAATGKLQGDELNQMAEAGVNATAALAKHLGKTQAEVREMVSKGQIDFQTFSDAMYATFGTAASGANETFGGAMSNVRAALSRVGEQFASPALDALRQVFVALMPVIDATAAALKPVADEFADFLEGVVPKLTTALDGAKSAIEGLGEGGFTNLPGGVKLAAAAIAMFSVGSLGGLISKIPIVGDALGGLFGALGGLATPVGSLRSLFGGLTTAAGGLSIPMTALIAVGAALAAGFAYLFATNEQFRSSVMTLGGEMAATLAPIMQQMADTLLPAIMSAAQTLLPVIGQIVLTVMQLVAAIAPVVTSIASALIPVVSQLIEIAAQVVAQIATLVLPIIQQVADLIAANMPAIQSVITSVTSVIQQAIAVAWPIIQQVITSAMAAIRAVIDTVWPIIQSVVQTAMGVIQGVITAVTGLISGNWSQVWEGIKQVASSVWEGIKGIVSGAACAVSGFVSNLVSSVTGFFSNLRSSITSKASSMWSSVTSSFRSGVSNAINFVANLPGRIMGIFSNAGSWLVNSGRSIINGLVSGIQNAIGGAVNAVSNAVGRIRNLFPFSPAKDGPFSGKGWVYYSGLSIMDAMGEGAQSEASKTVRTYAGIADKVRDALDITPNIGAVDYGSASMVDYGSASRSVGQKAGNIDNSSRNVTFNITMDGGGDPREMAQELYTLFKRSERGYAL